MALSSFTFQMISDWISEVEVNSLSDYSTPLNKIRQNYCNYTALWCLCNHYYNTASKISSLRLNLSPVAIKIEIYILQSHAFNPAKKQHQKGFKKSGKIGKAWS